MSNVGKNIMYNWKKEKKKKKKENMRKIKRKEKIKRNTFLVFVLYFNLAVIFNCYILL